MNGYIRVCHCSHDISSHYEEKHTCLGMLCDCAAYADRDDPKPKKVTKTAPAPAPVHDPDPGIATPVLPHAMWCTCATCLAAWGPAMP